MRHHAEEVNVKSHGVLLLVAERWMEGVKVDERVELS